VESAVDRIIKYGKEYLSIGITEDGSGRKSFGIPWEATCQAYNMKLPDVYFSPEEIKDHLVIEELLKHKVVGCYIFTAIDDYSFLKNFRDIRDLTIYEGVNLKDISFMRDLEVCKMLTLHKAHLSDLEDIFASKRRIKKDLFSPYMTCLALDDCIIDDYGTMFDGGISFTELIIFQNENSKEEEKLMAYKKPIPVHTYRCYIFREKTKEEKKEGLDQ